MGFRFRHSTRLGPLRFNFSKGGLSSFSDSGRDASFNIPVNRSGGPRSTMRLPGTGLSWSVEHTPNRPSMKTAGPAAALPNSRRLLESHPPPHISFESVGVTTHRSAPSSPLEKSDRNGEASTFLAEGGPAIRTTAV